jgi:hypothetical protein
MLIRLGRDDDHHLFASLGGLSLMVAFPLFLLILITRKVPAWTMWLLTVTSYCGEYAFNFKECSRTCGNANILVVAAISLLELPVILSIFISAIVVSAFHFARSKALQTNNIE